MNQIVFDDPDGVGDFPAEIAFGALFAEFGQNLHGESGETGSLNRIGLMHDPDCGIKETENPVGIFQGIDPVSFQPQGRKKTLDHVSGNPERAFPTEPGRSGPQRILHACGQDQDLSDVHLIRQSVDFDHHIPLQRNFKGHPGRICMEKFRLLIPEGAMNKTDPAGIRMLNTVFP